MNFYHNVKWMLCVVVLDGPAVCAPAIPGALAMLQAAPRSSMNILVHLYTRCCN